MEGCRRRVTSALRELAGRLPRGGDGEVSREEVGVYAAVTRLRGVVGGPDVLITLEMLERVDGACLYLVLKREGCLSGARIK